MRKFLWIPTLFALTLSAGVACGSDGDDADTSTTTTSEAADTTSSTDGSEGTTATFPSDEFCAAEADLAGAQDGAQRNTAIGEMQDALTDDAPPAVAAALSTLLTGDLAAEAYTAAEATLSDVCA